MFPLNIEFHWPETAIEIVTTIVVAWICRVALRKLVRRTVARADQRSGEHTALEMGRAATMVATPTGLNTNRGAQRTKTLGTVLMSVTDVVLLISVVLTILNSLSINIRPALASAGIVGIAVGFGAQTLVKDLFSGIFMIMEDQYGVGDIIEIGKLKGTVRSVGFRVTELQDFNGEVWYVRNGDISTVGNVSQGYSQSFFTIPVSVEEDPHRVIRLFSRMLTKMDAEPDWHNKMLEEPTVLGLTNVDASTAQYEIMIKCPANQQWDVEREIRARALSLMSQQSIRRPHQLIASIKPRSAETTVDMPAPVRRRRVSRAARANRRQDAALAGSRDNPQDRGQRPTEGTGPATQTEQAAAGAPARAGGRRTPPEQPRSVVPAEPDDDSEATRNHQQAVPQRPPVAAGPEPSAEQDEVSTTEANRARAWLDNGADRSVRWVSASDTGHNMAAEETVVLDSGKIRRQAKGPHLPGRRPHDGKDEQ